MMEELTEFQITCERKVSEALSGINRKISDRSIGMITDTFFDHANEKYIHGKIESTEIELWIYDDGAMFSGPGIDARYEHEDFKSSAELISAFVTELVAKLKNE